VPGAPTIKSKRLIKEAAMNNVKTGKPDWVTGLAPGSELFIDLRRFVRYGLEPLPAIEELLEELRPCQILRLATREEPVLLCHILGERGFEHYAENHGREWDVYFRKCGWRVPSETQ
jgi:hypothetical protein